MEIVLNGTVKKFGGASLYELLKELDVSEKYVAVSVNGNIVPRDAHRGCMLNDGNSVEIVHPVGGG